jgi:PAS domain S-box-containing protein
MSFQDGHGRGIDDEQYRLAAQASPAAMILAAADGEIWFVDAETEHLFGYRAEGVIGGSIDILVPAQIRHAHAGMRRSFVASPIKCSTGVGRDPKATRRDGTEFPAEVGLTPIESEGELLVLGQSSTSLLEFKRKRRCRGEPSSCRGR